ncbi:hypothetical protein Tco_0336158 [Tanacetum coccineum]
MANISICGSDVISEDFEQRLNIDLSSREKMIDSQMDDMIKEKLALKEQVDSLEQNLSKQIKRGKRQRVPFEYFVNNDLKYLQGGVSTMTYTTSTTKSKAAQYDLPGIQSRGDVYSTKRILAVTHVKVMRKHGYGYLEEIVVRRVDNNRLINLSGDDVADFAIALRMFTRILVIQKRVEDLQLGVESYQKKINVTKPDTTRPDLRKRHPDGTLTRLLSSLEDITKNIDMEYLPKRRWSTLENKRAHFMIKDINKLLKERRIMRSLEKFVSDRLYETDLRLLQRTI